MRLLLVTVLMLAAVLAASMARAQTYDPNFPICLQTFGRDSNYIGCQYTSMAQCRMSAWGTAAQCIANPYFPPKSPRKIFRRYRRRP